MDNDKFSRRLAALRVERGWTQKDLAERSGISQTSIANYERGMSAPNLDKACVLAKTLGCSLNTLVGIDSRYL